MSLIWHHGFPVFVVQGVIMWLTRAYFSDVGSENASAFVSACVWRVNVNAPALFICKFYNLSVIVRLMGCDSRRRAHKLVPAAVRTCCLQVVCICQRKRLTLNWAGGIFGAESGNPCIQSRVFLLSLISHVQYPAYIYASGSYVCIKRERRWKLAVFPYLVFYARTTWWRMAPS